VAVTNDGVLYHIELRLVLFTGTNAPGNFLMIPFFNNTPDLRESPTRNHDVESAAISQLRRFPASSKTSGGWRLDDTNPQSRQLRADLDDLTA